MPTTKKSVPGAATPDGTQVTYQVKHTPKTLSSQELKQTVAAVAMTIAGLRLELTEKFGVGEAYRMLIKMFQLACMDKEVINAEARAAEIYFMRKEKAK